jgi:streptomycin 6-kinase
MDRIEMKECEMKLIEFTQEQQKNMARCFGGKFLETLPAQLADYANLWQLSDFSLIEYYSNNCLLTCRSTRCGDCVLKIYGREYEGNVYEARFLAAVKGNGQYVQAYEIDEKGGAVLPERIQPGTTLKAEPSMEIRLSAFATAWQNAHATPPDPDLFESYLDATKRAAKASWAGGEIPELRRAAQNMVSVCRELYDRYPARALLHSDLHGDNLLKNSDGGYTTVDPHGRIGPPICDLGRYIANEYFDADENARNEVTTYVIAQLSERLALPQIDVSRAFFVDITLMSCWGAEYGETSTCGALFAESLLSREMVK